VLTQPPRPETTGWFFVLDGLDGSGKSTQLNRLAAELRRQGYTVTTAMDPGGTPLGGRIREILLHRSEIEVGLTAETLLFLASRAQLVTEVIQPALTRGEIVLCDRYELSTYVYQSWAGGLAESLLRPVAELARQGVLPHHIWVLDVPYEVAKQPGKPTQDRLESRGRDFFEQVRAGYLNYANQEPQRIHVLSALASPEVVHAELLGQVQGVLQGGSP